MKFVFNAYRTPTHQQEHDKKCNNYVKITSAHFSLF